MIRGSSCLVEAYSLLIASGVVKLTLMTQRQEVSADIEECHENHIQACNAL